MSEDQFTRLFKYMQERFDKIDSELETKATTEQVDKIYQTLDGITDRLNTQESEMAALLVQDREA
ncbi:hypothetical protein GCM10009839_63460 [Catenulispora yoronensis]|uniref:Uncharacterized protein n=1 Tax=Catenulispora yoronensis TaxID=450799 RepID=A0ABN2V352_9ACTN